MRPLFVLLFAVTVFAVPVVAAPVPKGLKKTEPPSVNGRWKMTGYNGNGKLLPPDRNPDWVIDDEKVIIGNDTKPLTFQDPDRPLRKFDGLPAVVMLVDDTLYFCYARVSDMKVTECKPGLGIDIYVLEPVKDK